MAEAVEEGQIHGYSDVSCRIKRVTARRYHNVCYLILALVSSLFF